MQCPYKLVQKESRRARDAIEAKWHKTLAERGASLYNVTSLSGATPPSVFVGSYNYPEVYVGPMVPPVHGDTTKFDSPEQWGGLSLDEIIGFRLSMARGVRRIRVDKPHGRYVENLQAVSMSHGSTESDLVFDGPLRKVGSSDGSSPPFGPMGKVESARFSSVKSPINRIEKAYYDSDLIAADAIIDLYRSGVEISRIHQCLSIGMLGVRRRIVPTRWGITATDSTVSSFLLDEVIDYPIIDSSLVFWHEHLGNVFVVILFPHEWIYELMEAWYAHNVDMSVRPAQKPPVAFGSDAETAHRQRKPVATAGAYYAAKLGVLEYLYTKKVQAGALILREIKSEYVVPVGVWQVREGVRAAMSKSPVIVKDLRNGVKHAAAVTSIAESGWLSHCKMLGMLKQLNMSDFF